MKRQDLLEAVGNIHDRWVEEAHAPRKKTVGWMKWGALAACLVITVVLLLPGTALQKPQEPEAMAGPPSTEINGIHYILSSYLEIETELPQGFEYGGVGEVDGQSWEYYVNPDIPTWVYVYQEVYDNITQQSSMKYVRYVDSRIRGKDYISYDGRLYVSMWSAAYWGENPDVTRERYEQVEAEYGIRMKGQAPANFVHLGKAEFTGHDTIPDLPLGCNTGSPEVYLNTEDETILLAGTVWHTAPDANGEQRHEGYNLYILCDDPLK
ncbi:MAG: hypothetical protein J6B40_01570 [Oscillospiraceae bacterium]|nr:hypothetical protein [Oscillospiraceae bacterium]